MHPALADRRWFGLHLVAWTVAGGTVAFVTRASFGFSWLAACVFGLPLGFLGGAIALSAWYVLRATPDARSEPVRAGVTLTLAALACAAAWASTGRFWWRALGLLGFGVGDEAESGAFALLLTLGLAGYLLAAAAYQVGHALDTSSKAARRALEADIAQRDAELRALRAQVNPHFLFNSLNSIAGLIPGNPARAREMCQLLGEFLRVSLQVGPSQRIALDREVALVEQYLRIEQVRFGSRLAVTIAMAPGTTSASVPPLLLQPLVENAVRHGIATRLEGGTVAIETRRAGNRVVITVSNPRDVDARRGGTGFGLDIVRRRLAAAFGDAAGLTVEPAESSYRTSVTVPFEEQT